MDRPASVAHNDDHRLEERHFVEDFSLYFEQMGYPRMAGRILGWLLICDPPVQSAGELADVLGASKGSLSTMTRLLIQVGLIERAGVPGRRRDYFRIKPGAWPQLIKVQMQSMTGLHQMVERGLAMLATAHDGRRPRPGIDPASAGGARSVRLPGARAAGAVATVAGGASRLGESVRRSVDDERRTTNDESCVPRTTQYESRRSRSTHHESHPMILKNLIRRPMRSLLTLLGIAIGVATVVSLGAMAQGMMKNYGSVVGLSNDLLVSQANAFDVAYSSLDAELEQRLAAVPGVDEVDPGVYGWIVTDEMPFFLVFGYHPGSTAMAHYRITEGKPVTGPRQIAIGRRAADSLKKGIGSTLRLFGVPYEIVGIYETGQAMEESGGTVVLEDAQTITQKTRKVSLFQVGVRKGTDLRQVMARIEALEKDLAVSKSSEYDASEQWSQYLQGFAWGIAAIAILIGGLGMMNAMVMSVLERTREIGTLRAVGWSRRRVVTLILGETVVLSLIGGLVGIALGVGLTELAANAPGIGGMMEGAYSTGIFIQGLVTALCLGVLGGAYPAWVAANLQPVEALRYEGGGSGEVKGRLARVGNQSFRNLWRRRTRTFIAATGIGIGVATLVMMGGLIAGITGELNSLAGSSGTGNLTVMQRDVADMSMSSLDERVVSQIRNMPQVKSVSPMLLGFIVSSDMPFFMIAGLDPNSAAMSHYKLVEGRYVQRPNEVLLGKIAAKTYKVGVGDTLKLFENRYKVVGIAETGVAWEEGGAMVALREAQRLLNRPRSVSFIFVDVTDPSQAGAVRDAINRRFPEARASLSSEFAENTDDMANAEAMFTAIGFLALLVGGIVVANTLLMSVHERTREIGTLRALGWAKGRILSQIVQESLLLCILSAIVGSIMGVLLLVLAARAPGLNGLISARWDAQIFIQAIVLTLVVGLVASAYPAWRASRLQPVEALRYE